LSVAQSANHPVGTAAAFVATLNAKPIGVFSVRAVGEDILINKVVLSFTGVSNTNYLTAVGLYDGDSLVSDLKDTVNAASTDYTFTLSWTVPANTTKDLTVKAVTKNAGSDTGNAITVTLKSTSEGYGLASGEKITPSAATQLSAVTVYSAGTFTATLDDQKTPLNQGVLVGLNDVLLGAIKVRATREDMKLATLKLTPSSGGSNKVSDLVLYDESGNALSNPVQESSGVFTFDSDALLTNVVFPKDTYKTILVKGRVVGAVSSYYLSVNATSHFQAVGVESEQSANVSGTFNLGNTTQGTFVFTDKVIEMKKNASSPSGSVSRGSEQVYAIWDIYNPTGQDATITAITFTSKTGLPSSAPAGTATGTDTATFAYRLYDETGTRVLTSTTTAATSTGTVKFEGSLVVGPGVTKTLYLKINTTDTTKWPSGTYLHWSVLSATHVTVADSGAVGYAGTVWSIPADANQVTIY
jgi:hypothetical protein